MENRFNQKPSWLKVKFNLNENYKEILHIIKKNNLHTVCESALCPNRYECWNKKSATLMILGDKCTRKCGFCAIKKGTNLILDEDEPYRVADAIAKMKLKHVVITSVTRDDLLDGGASIWAQTIKAIRMKNLNCSIEVLTSDFQGNLEAQKLVFNEHPDIFSHNIETVPSLYPKVRPQANYASSMELLKRAKESNLITKTGIMVGLGEKFEEVISLMKEVKSIGVDIFTIGQYLQPTKENLPVSRYVSPEEFEEYKNYGISLGFLHIESSPLVRSSYNAGILWI